MDVAELNRVTAAYHNFDDGVIERVSVRFREYDGFGTAVFVLRAQKITDDGRWDWYRVTLSIGDVQDFRLTNTSSDYNLVLSGGLQLLFLDSRVVLIFNEHERIDTAEKAAACSWFLSGKTCEVKDQPYSVQAE
jgi:hypothetical protein